MARSLRETTLHVFSSSEDLELSRRFAEGHKAVLSASGISNLTSFNEEWIGDPDTTLFLLTCQNEEVLLSGMRLQKRQPDNALPMELAVRADHPEVVAVLDGVQEEGCAEFCALWSRRETAMAGIGMLPMACVGLGLMPRLDILHGYAFMGVNMRPIQRELGFSIKTDWGNEGVFPYPAPPIRSEIGHFMFPESIENAAPDVQALIRRSAEEPSHVHPIDGRFHPISYRIENHLA